MTTTLAGRSSRTVNGPLVGFVVAHVAAFAGMLALSVVVGPRLPAEARDFATAWIRLAAIGSAVLLLSILGRREDRDGYALETILPVSVGWVGFCLFLVVGCFVINLDRSVYQPPAGSATGLAITVVGAFASFGLGRHLAASASLRRMRRQTASTRRLAWLTDVGVDRSWRLLFGALLGVPTAAIAAFVLMSPESSPVLAGWLLVSWVVAVAAGQRATVFITDAGIRVSGRLLLGARGWSLPIAQIASVRVLDANPFDALRSRNPSRCILRSGPALEVRSTSGGAYAVSLPDAEAAAAVLNRLVEERAAR